MSFMKILNKRGPRIDHCGTSSSILHHSLKLLSIFTQWNQETTRTRRTQSVAKSYAFHANVNNPF